VDNPGLLVTCEHGGNRVPEEYLPLFAGRGTLLAGHRGFDPGAAELARDLAARFNAPLILSEVTRLLVDLNRTEGRPGLFSEVTLRLPRSTRRRILERYYRPYRDRVEETVNRLQESSKGVLHLSVHSFTPHLRGRTRTADFGILYDPKRSREALLARDWRKELRVLLPELRVRMNYPYRGTADGLATDLRKRWGGSVYAGLEIEVNQSIPLSRPELWVGLKMSLGRSLSLVFPGERPRGSMSLES
jgi:predicted N-formylglutamate amidohydrolase